MDVYNIANIWNVGHRTEIFISINDSSATTFDYDPLFESIFEIFDAKESN